jgi:hypothetical protein
MANDLSGDVWIFDTITTTPVFTGQVKILTIIWKAPANVGDELVLMSKDGKVILSAEAEVVGQSQIFRLGKWYNGLQIGTIDSGVAYVHYL